MLDIKARDRVGRYLGPFVRAFQKMGLTPNAITLIGLGLTVAGAALIGIGEPIAGVLVAAAGTVLDLFDGPLARATGKAGPRGAFLDTVSDRLGEITLWVGVAAYMAGNDLAMVLVALGLGFSLLIPFIRSKAEAAGVEGKGGIMGKAERNIVLLAGFGFSAVGAPLEMATLWAMAVLTGITAAQRIYLTWVRLAG